MKKNIFRKWIYNNSCELDNFCCTKSKNKDRLKIRSNFSIVEELKVKKRNKWNVWILCEILSEVQVICIHAHHAYILQCFIFINVQFYIDWSLLLLSNHSLQSAPSVFNLDQKFQRRNLFSTYHDATQIRISKEKHLLLCFPLSYQLICAGPAALVGRLAGTS